MNFNFIFLRTKADTELTDIAKNLKFFATALNEITFNDSIGRQGLLILRSNVSQPQDGIRRNSRRVQLFKHCDHAVVRARLLLSASTAKKSVYLPAESA